MAGIVDAMRKDLENLPWMDDFTRKRAFAKLDLVSHLVGGPVNPEYAAAPPPPPPLTS